MLWVKTHRINFTTFFRLGLWFWWWKVQTIPAERANLQCHPLRGRPPRRGNCACHVPACCLFPGDSRMGKAKTGSVRHTVAAPSEWKFLEASSPSDSERQVSLLGLWEDWLVWDIKSIFLSFVSPVSTLPSPGLSSNERSTRLTPQARVHIL